MTRSRYSNKRKSTRKSKQGRRHARRSSSYQPFKYLFSRSKQIAYKAGTVALATAAILAANDVLDDVSVPRESKYKNQASDLDLYEYVDDLCRDVKETDELLRHNHKLVDRLFTKVKKKVIDNDFKNTMEIRYYLENKLPLLYVQVYKSLDKNSFEILPKETLIRLIDIHPLVHESSSLEIINPSKRSKLVDMINTGKIKSLFDLRMKYTFA